MSYRDILRSLKESVQSVRPRYYIPVAAALLCQLAFHWYIISNDSSIGDEDAAVYALQGHAVARGEGLMSSVVGCHYTTYESVHHPEDYWPPLQSYLVACSRKLTGNSIFSDKLPNVIGFSVLIISVFLISLSFFQPPVAVLGSLLCLVCADLALYAIGSRSDLWQVLLLIVCFYFFSGAFTDNRSWFRNAAIAGAAAGLAYLQRSISLLIVPTCLAWPLLHAVFTAKTAPQALTTAKRWLLPCAVFCALFAVVILPYSVRNYKLFDSILPGLLPAWGAVNLEEYIRYPDARSSDRIDASLSTMQSMRNVYFDKMPSIDLRSQFYRTAMIRRGLKEIGIQLIMFKRSLIIEFTLIVLACLSFFLLHGRARGVLSLFLIYLALSLPSIPFTAHAEQRYFIFVIPFTCMYATFMLFELEKFLLAGSAGNRVFRYTYRAFIGCLLAFLFLVPAVKLYRSAFTRISTPQQLVTIGTWLRAHTDSSTVIMSTAPYRISYYAQRPVVMLPDTTPDMIRRVCDHYGISMLAVPPAETSRLDSAIDTSSGLNPFTLIATVDGNTMYSYTPRTLRLDQRN
jgi:hypothetical protein